MISRLYADLLHLRDPNGPRIYDTDLSGNSIVTRFPDKTLMLDLSVVGDQLKMFDGVLAQPERNHVLDLSADMLHRFFKIFDDINFEDGAADAGVEITIHHVIDPSIASVATALEISKLAPKSRFVPVRNMAIGDCLVVDGASEIYKNIMFESQMVIPYLEPEMQAWTESPDFTYTGFLMGRHKDIPYETRIVIMDFLESIYDQRDARLLDFR